MPEAYLKGLEEIAGIDPLAGLAFVEELKTVSPDFAEYFVGFAWGKIHARTVLEAKFKELIAIATLVATSDSKDHLRLRIKGAYRKGCTKEEVVEVIIQSIVHVGFTRALRALGMVREISDEYEADHATGATTEPPPDFPPKSTTKEEKGGKQKKSGA